MHALSERAALRAAHFHSPTPTLGAEEELHIVDADGKLVSYAVEPLEFQTPVGRSPNEVVEFIAAMRAVAAARARARGHRVLCAGLHPSARWNGQGLNDKTIIEARTEVLAAISGGLLRVHLGIARASLRVEVMNRMRDVLPMLLAISANSPYYEGRDTGLQSWRHSLIGMNEPLGEAISLHDTYGTLEVRIMDPVFSLDRLWLIVALLQAEAMTIEAELLANRPPMRTPRMLLEGNKWAARRHGMKASFIDWNSGRRIEFKQAFEMWLHRLIPAALHLGYGLRLELAARTAMWEGTLPDKQRQWFRQSGSMPELVDQLVAETSRPLSKWLVDPEVV